MKMKHFFLLVFCLIMCNASVFSQTLYEVGKGYSQTSVNTTIFRHNSLVTHEDTQYISYYDENGYVVIGKRKTGKPEWELKRTKYQGNCKDAHNGISMMVDGDGYIHLSFDHHGHPLNYCKSYGAGSLEMGEKIPMTGVDEENVTYPEFYRFNNGDLLFVYRSGSSGRGNMVMNRYDTSTKRWSQIQNILIDGEGQRNAYWQLYVDEQDVIHASWVWRETPDVATNHDMCYARSTDGGISWEKSNGEKYTLPITAENAEYVCQIPQQSELINQTSMTADKKSNPYIATYWREGNSKVPQYRIIWFDGEQWNQQQVSQRTTPFSLSGGGTKSIPVSRPRLVIKDKGKKKEVYYIFRDAERGRKVTLAHTSDLQKGTWQFKDLTDFSVDAWEPGHDTELWKAKGKLNLFVQRTAQGDGERSVETPATPVYVLEVK